MPGLGFLVATLLSAVPPPSSALGIEGCDFGEAYAFGQAQCQIAIDNTGEKPVRLSNIRADSANDSADVKELSVAPHGRAYLPVRVVLDNTSGPSRHSFRMQTDEPGQPEVNARAYGFALSVLDEQPEFDFGIVDLTQTKAAERSILLNSHDVADFRVLKVIDKPAWVDTDLSPDGHSLTARVRADAPLGLYAEFIKLQLNAPKQSQAWISVKADLRGDVIPAANPLVMGLIRVGDSNEFRIPLTSRSGKDFKLGKLELDRVPGDVKASSCVPDVAGCRWLNLRISDKPPYGTIKGNVFVELPDEHKRLKVAIRGLLVKKDFKVKTLDPNQPGAASTTGATTGSPSQVDVSKALRNVVEQAGETSPAGTGPLLKWTVSNGLVIHGFQIFRSDKEEGPFVLLNQATVRSKAEDDGPVLYQYRDNAAVSGKTYWYYIGTVYGDGHKKQLTQPQKVVAK